MKQIVRAALLAALFGVFALPRAAFADVSCTAGYETCIAESGMLGGVMTHLGDLECAVEYAGCLAGKLRFW